MRIENSFIPVSGVGETTERRLWADGVTHWDDFEPSAVGPKTADRIEEFIEQAAVHLDDGNAAYFDRAFPSGSHWRLYENFREDACFLDIETTGLDQYRNDVTVVSLHRGGETKTFVNGRDLSAERLSAELADSQLLVTFNGKRFDVPFLETAFDLDVSLPHVDLMYPCKRIGLSGGLKTIEKDVGLERDRPDLSGEDAVRLWREYEAGDESALETLVSYNRDDTVNLQWLMDHVTERLHDDVFEAARADSV
ncbi:ribonuclease H-like domain-containing protein [Haloarculaceae archaeon H-GB2-1]|nr:ribonuclease H-like domain-containing protein [Haloarculaceae archaeon H-GB1-1]MEA5386877.1 ribonuclease H-like domain-containing protein [Haloarculaceae archaeon H-GB11]MEA5408355.1 ribonuclease H-like domain-containing protein [Haloarculaceae archaeon H-GB2-1]